jgi:hypothetical protein
MDARITLIDVDDYGENGERRLLVIKRGCYRNVEEMEMIAVKLILICTQFSTNENISAI